MEIPNRQLPAGEWVAVKRTMINNSVDKIPA